MTKIIKSVCGMCGPAYSGCGIDVHVEGGRVVRVEGTKGHPSSNGKLCPKAYAAIQRLYDPQRILYPMKRVGERGEGKFERISWDEAMDTIVGKFKEIIRTDGVRAIGVLRGQGPDWNTNYDLIQRFVNLLDTPNLGMTGYNCHFGRGIGHAMTYGWMPDPDYENTNLMILWGYNPVNTGMPHAMRILKAKKRGVKLIVVDPRFSKTASKADIFVQLRPGSDLALALGMLNIIISENLYDKEFVDKWTYGFEKLAEHVKQYPPEKVEEITWVPAKRLREITRMYAMTKPALLHSSNGIDQIPNTCKIGRAHSILQTITGNLNVPGGNVLDPEAGPMFTPRRVMDGRKRAPKDMEEAFKNSVGKFPLYFHLGYLSNTEVHDAMVTEKPYPIKAALSLVNDAVISPDTNMVRQALRKLSFHVAFGVEKNPTADLADILLPAATFLERDILNEWWYGSKPKVGANFYQLQRKVVEPLGEARSDYDFFTDLAWRFGFQEEWPWKTIEEYTDYILEPVGLTFRELAEHPEDIIKKSFTPKYLYEDSLKKCLSLPFFPQRKIALYSDFLEKSGNDPLLTYIEPAETPLSRPDLLDEYPFVCMASIKPGLFVHSQYRQLPWLKELMPGPFVEIHSETAEKLGIKDGDQVVVKSPRGSIEIEARVVDSFDPRVVGITHGWWNPPTNILTPSKYPEFRDPVVGATSNRCFLVSVTKK